MAFGHKALVSGDLDELMLKYLRNALENRFVVPPAVLSNPPNKTSSFLGSLVKEMGPVFIVLDKIGKAFEDPKLDDIQRRERFMLFCTEVIQDWMLMKDVFILIAGRGSFLSYVGLRPDAKTIEGSPFHFPRPSLHLLREEAIKQILKKTLMVADGKKTVQEHFELDEERLSIVAKKLFLSTNGHPRTKLAALQKCESVTELENYNDPVDYSSWKLFFGALIRFREIVNELLKSVEDGSFYNLTSTYSDAGGKKISHDIIANQAFISWEGTVDNARLYTHPFVKMILENYFCPLKEYLSLVGDISKVSIDYSNVFEWICLKRFQEIFSTPQQPNLILPLFFSTVLFGNLCGLCFSRQLCPFQKLPAEERGLLI